MGYTHYWYQSKPFTTDEWAAIRTEAQAIVARAKVAGIAIVCGDGDKDGRPVIDADMILLNGAGDEGAYEDFELLCEPEIDPGDKESFTFCKTAHRPYDAVVVSILSAAQTIAPDKIKVSSDGGDEAIKRVF